MDVDWSVLPRELWTHHIFLWVLRMEVRDTVRKRQREMAMRRCRRLDYAYMYLAMTAKINEQTNRERAVSHTIWMYAACNMLGIDPDGYRTQQQQQRRWKQPPQVARGHSDFYGRGELSSWLSIRATCKAWLHMANTVAGDAALSKKHGLPLVPVFTPHLVHQLRDTDNRHFSSAALEMIEETVRQTWHTAGTLWASFSRKHRGKARRQGVAYRECAVEKELRLRGTDDSWGDFDADADDDAATSSARRKAMFETAAMLLAEHMLNTCTYDWDATMARAVETQLKAALTYAKIVPCSFVHFAGSPLEKYTWNLDGLVDMVTSQYLPRVGYYAANSTVPPRDPLLGKSLHTTVSPICLITDYTREACEKFKPRHGEARCGKRNGNNSMNSEPAVIFGTQLAHITDVVLGCCIQSDVWQIVLSRKYESGTSKALRAATKLVDVLQCPAKCTLTVPVPSHRTCENNNNNINSRAVDNPCCARVAEPVTVDQVRTLRLHCIRPHVKFDIRTVNAAIQRHWEALLARRRATMTADGVEDVDEFDRPLVPSDLEYVGISDETFLARLWKVSNALERLEFLSVVEVVSAATAVELLTTATPSDCFDKAIVDTWHAECAKSDERWFWQSGLPRSLKHIVIWASTQAECVNTALIFANGCPSDVVVEHRANPAIDSERLRRYTSSAVGAYLHRSTAAGDYAGLFG